MSPSKSQLCTIVPAFAQPGQPTPTMGTRVMLPDGQVMGGVTKVTIVAATNDLWRAVIECFVEPSVLPGVTFDIERAGKPLTWWRRLLLVAAGVRAVDISAIDAQERAWISVSKRMNDDANEAVHTQAEAAQDTDAAGARDEQAAAQSACDQQHDVAKAASGTPPE